MALIRPKKKINPDASCDNCPYKHWITDKEYLYSQYDGKPIILECHHTHERIVRGTHVCNKHPQYYL